MAGGRPLKFESPEAMQKAIDAYFASCAEPRQLGDTIYFEPVTITGLALALDTTRDLLGLGTGYDFSGVNERTAYG